MDQIVVVTRMTEYCTKL